VATDDAAALDTLLDVLFIQARTLAEADPQSVASKQTLRMRSHCG